MCRTPPYLLLLLLAAVGCSSPLKMWRDSDLIAVTSDVPAAAEQVQMPLAPDAAPPLDEQAAAVMAELHGSGKLTAEELAQLEQDLRDVPDALRPMVVRNLRATLAGKPAAPDFQTGDSLESSFAAAKADLLGPVEGRAALASSRRPAVQPLAAAPEVIAPVADLLDAAAAAVAAAEEGTQGAPRPLPGRVDLAAFFEVESPATAAPASFAEMREPNVAATHAAPPAAVDEQDWRQALQEAIARLAEDDEGDKSPAARAARLRLLQLAAGEQEAAVAPIEPLDPREQAFWSNQMHALAIYLDHESLPLQHRRAALAMVRLREAMSYLAAASTLEVRNLAFCTEVECYGRYTPFEQYRFRPDQEVILYVEVDNFSADETAEGFETELQGSYQILDAAGRRVFDHTFTAEREVCRNRRRDYFIPYRIYMPKGIYPGRYTLQFTMEDLKAKKFGQSAVAFEIVP